MQLRSCRCFGLFCCSCISRCSFQAFLCQGLARRVLRVVVLGHFALSREYSVDIARDDCMECCYVVYWEEECLKKICVDSRPIDQKFPDAELVPIARVLCSVEDAPWPVSNRNCSPLLLRVFSENRRDARQFIVNEPFEGNAFLQCFRQAHQDVFCMVELITLVEYIVRRMKSASHKECTEDKVVLRRCTLKGAVDFADLRRLVADLVELWTLMTKKVGELPELRFCNCAAKRCRQFIYRLIVVTVTSGVSRYFYSFCPEILFEGDDSGVFALFAVYVDY